MSELNWFENDEQDKLNKKPGGIPETDVLDQAELDALLAQPNRETTVGCRNYALLQLMAQTGIRCGEALQIMPEDITEETWGNNGDSRRVTVLRLRRRTTKGKRGRIGIPLIPKTLSAIRDWEEVRRGLGVMDGPLFCTTFRGQHRHCASPPGGDGCFVTWKTDETALYPGRALNSRYVRQVVSEYAKKVGIAKRVHPHMLRHTALTRLYNDTKDLKMVQTVAGHSNSRMTERYVHVHPLSIADAFGVTG